MDNLMNTIKQRYGQYTSYRGLSTLTHRGRYAVTKKSGLTESRSKASFDALLPHFTFFGKRIRDETEKLMERREKTAFQALGKEIPRMIQRQAMQWRTETAKARESQVGATKQLQRRVELFAVDTGSKLKAVQRELERLKLSEKARRQTEAKPVNELPLSRKAAKDIINGRTEELLREVADDLVRTEHRITRKLRDEEEYEKRRRG